jgi:hypothetical protein
MKEASGEVIDSIEAAHTWPPPRTFEQFAQEHRAAFAG